MSFFLLRGTFFKDSANIWPCTIGHSELKVCQLGHTDGGTQSEHDQVFGKQALLLSHTLKSLQIQISIDVTLSWET